MLIVREVDAGKQSFFSACSFGDKTCRFSRADGKYEQLLSAVKLTDAKKKLLLLDENKFSWKCVPVVAKFEQPCTLTGMKQIIDPLFDKYTTHDAERLFYYMEDITIDGEPTDYYIGKTGTIRFLLHIVSMWRNYWYESKAVLGEGIQGVHFYPSSFFTLHHIKKSLKKTNGTLLYIGENHTKRIVFENGIYKEMEVFDLGWQLLKDVYAENNIRDFFDAPEEQIENNTYAKNLVEQSIHFYVDMLIRWLRSSSTRGDIFLVSTLTNNPYFMKIFTSAYQQYSLSFVVPITHVKGLKTYGRKRSVEDIDIQTASHYFI